MCIGYLPENLIICWQVKKTVRAELMRSLQAPPCCLSHHEEIAVGRYKFWYLFFGYRRQWSRYLLDEKGSSLLDFFALSMTFWLQEVYFWPRKNRRGLRSLLCVKEDISFQPINTFPIKIKLWLFICDHWWAVVAVCGDTGADDYHWIEWWIKLILKWWYWCDMNRVHITCNPNHYYIHHTHSPSSHLR